MRNQQVLGRAFSLVELVMVIMIIGIVAAIAVPRITSAAERTRVANLRSSLRVLNQSVDYYSAEHDGRTPAHEPDNSISTNATLFVQRLIDKSNPAGTTGTGLFGPYLLRMPKNPYNGLDTLRIDGAAKGAATHGWHFSSTFREFRADDSLATASVAAASVSVDSIEGRGGGATVVEVD